MKLRNVVCAIVVVTVSACVPARSESVSQAAEIARLPGSMFLAIRTSVDELDRKVKYANVSQYEISVMQSAGTVTVRFEDPRPRPSGWRGTPPGYLPGFNVILDGEGRIEKSYFDR